MYDSTTMVDCVKDFLYNYYSNGNISGIMRMIDLVLFIVSTSGNNGIIEVYHSVGVRKCCCCIRVIRDDNIKKINMDIRPQI